MKSVTLFLLSAMALASCHTTVTSRASADPEIRDFLETWLVRRDISQAMNSLGDDFFLQPEQTKASFWPEAIRSLAPKERVLRFPFECPGFPSHCSRLGDCIRSESGEDSLPFETQQLSVTRTVARELPELANLVGDDLSVTIFMLNGCNLGASVISKKEGGGLSVVSIFFLAG